MRTCPGIVHLNRLIESSIEQLSVDLAKVYCRRWDGIHLGRMMMMMLMLMLMMVIITMTVMLDSRATREQRCGTPGEGTCLNKALREQGIDRNA